MRFRTITVATAIGMAALMPAAALAQDDAPPLAGNPPGAAPVAPGEADGGGGDILPAQPTPDKADAGPAKGDVAAPKATGDTTTPPPSPTTTNTPTKISDPVTTTTSSGADCATATSSSSSSSTATTATSGSCGGGQSGTPTEVDGCGTLVANMDGMNMDPTPMHPGATAGADTPPPGAQPPAPTGGAAPPAPAGKPRAVKTQGGGAAATRTDDCGRRTAVQGGGGTPLAAGGGGGPAGELPFTGPLPFAWVMALAAGLMLSGVSMFVRVRRRGTATPGDRR